MDHYKENPYIPTGDCPNIFPVGGDKPMQSEPKAPLTIFPLRLPRSTRMEAAAIAEREGMSLNEFIALALSEKFELLESLYRSTSRRENA